MAVVMMDQKSIFSTFTAKQFEDFQAFEASFAEEVESWTTLKELSHSSKIPGVQAHLKELAKEGVEFPTELFLPVKHLESALPYFSKFTGILGLFNIIDGQTVRTKDGCAIFPLISKDEEDVEPHEFTVELEVWWARYTGASLQHIDLSSCASNFKLYLTCHVLALALQVST